MKTASSFAVAVAFLIVSSVAQAGTKKKVTHTDLTITQKNDKASPQLSQNTTTTSPHPSATPVRKAAAKKTTVSEGVLNGKAISKPQPAYPPIAK